MPSPLISACRLSAAPAAPPFKSSTRTAAQSLPGTDPTGPEQTTGNFSDWEEEESLDIEWAHAAAPLANIILFEADTHDDLFTAVDTAANTLRRGGRLDELGRT